VPHDPVLTLAARGGGDRSFFRGQCRWGRCCLTTTVEHFHYTRGAWFWNAMSCGHMSAPSGIKSGFGWLITATQARL